MELLDAGTKQLTRALEQCGDAATEIAAILAAGNIGDEERLLIQQAFGQLTDGFQASASAIGRIFKGVIVMAEGINWEQAKEGVKQVLAAVNDAFGISDKLYQSMESLQNAFSHLADMGGKLQDGIDALAGSLNIFESGARDLGDVFNDIHDLFEDLSTRDPIEIDKLGDDFHQAQESLHNAVTGIGDHMGLLRDEIGDSGDTLSDDIRSIGDQFQTITDLISSAIDEAQKKELNDLWDDVSEEVIDSTTLGKAKSCINFGVVKGDLNIGGIAGAMAVERDLDPEDEIVEVGEQSLNFRYETRAILQSCVNHGSVTSKKDAAGGIVGYMDLGYLWKCENYGAVKTTDGKYTGGIAGISNSSIHGCWSKCTLNGRYYVGGIAGYGYEVYQCTSLISVKSSEGRTGSVVGDWDREDGVLKQNRFVEGHLAGADGISYKEQAEPVSYNALIQSDDVPEPFLQMNVTYMVDEIPLKTVSYDYGDRFSTKEIPEVPQKDKYYGVWKTPEDVEITSDHIIEAIYNPFITTLSSNAKRDNVRSVFLVEGIFDEHAGLSAQLIESGDQYERWEVILSDKYDSAMQMVRYAPPEDWEKISIRIVPAGAKDSIQVTTELDGSYFIFPVETTNFVIEIENHASNRSTSIGLFITGFLLLFIIAIIFSRKKVKKKNGPYVNTEEPPSKLP